MFQKLLASISLIFLFSIFSSAQFLPSNDEASLKMNGHKKKKQKVRVLGNGIFDLNYFLPENDNSWTLSLTTSGGFAGITRLVAAVNSNGNYLCTPNGEFRNKLLEKNSLDEIFDFVETLDYSSFNQTMEAEIKGCMDCSYSTLTLQTRNGFFSRSQAVFSNAENNVRQIYDRLSSLEECR